MNKRVSEMSGTWGSSNQYGGPGQKYKDYRLTVLIRSLQSPEDPCSGVSLRSYRSIPGVLMLLIRLIPGML
jgi:hypothetical protein